MGLTKFLVVATGALSLTTCVAQTNNTGNDCENPYFENGYNATGSITTPGFRINDIYPVSTWTWSQYINDYKNGSGDNTSFIWQTIGLKTDPVQNLSSPSIPYTACAFALNGVTYAKNAQRDNGTCSSVFSSSCLKAIQNSLSSQAASLSGQPTTSIQPCSQFLPESLTVKGGPCEGIFAGWSSSAFMPTAFPGPTPNKTGCTAGNPGDSNATTGDFLAWSSFADTGSDNFTGYDAAIMNPQPIFIAAWLKNTTSSGLSSSNTGNPPWSDTRVMCIPGNTTVAGSRNITVAEKAANDAGRIGSISLVVVGLAVFVGLFF